MINEENAFFFSKIAHLNMMILKLCTSKKGTEKQDTIFYKEVWPIIKKTFECH
jgi:hypothetical protein